MVFTSLIASMATLALNSEPNVLLDLSWFRNFKVNKFLSSFIRPAHLKVMKKIPAYVIFSLKAMSVILIFQYCSEVKVDVNNNIMVTDAYWKTFEFTLGMSQILADEIKNRDIELNLAGNQEMLRK